MPRHGKGSRQKVAAAKGQTYGDRVAQEEAQRVVPLPSMPVMRPGQSGPLNRPTERGREPVTAGAPIGPGSGPSVMPRPTDVPDRELSDRLAAYLPILEKKAAQSEASANFRMFVRRVRHLAVRQPGVY